MSDFEKKKPSNESKIKFKFGSSKEHSAQKIKNMGFDDSASSATTNQTSSATANTEQKTGTSGLFRSSHNKANTNDTDNTRTAQEEPATQEGNQLKLMGQPAEAPSEALL